MKVGAHFRKRKKSALFLPDPRPLTQQAREGAVPTLPQHPWQNKWKELSLLLEGLGVQ